MAVYMGLIKTTSVVVGAWMPQEKKTKKGVSYEERRKATSSKRMRTHSVPLATSAYLLGCILLN